MASRTRVRDRTAGYLVPYGTSKQADCDSAPRRLVRREARCDARQLSSRHAAGRDRRGTRLPAARRRWRARDQGPRRPGTRAGHGRAGQRPAPFARLIHDPRPGPVRHHAPAPTRTQPSGAPTRRPRSVHASRPRSILRAARGARRARPARDGENRVSLPLTHEDSRSAAGLPLTSKTGYPSSRSWSAISCSRAATQALTRSSLAACCCCISRASARGGLVVDVRVCLADGSGRAPQVPRCRGQRLRVGPCVTRWRDRVHHLSMLVERAHQAEIKPFPSGTVAAELDEVRAVQAKAEARAAV